MGFLKKQWFLIGLAIALLAGSLFSKQLLPVIGLKEFRYSIVASVLFLMSLPLAPAAVGDTFRRPWPSILAIFFNIVALPLFTWPIAVFFLSDSYAAGLLIAVSVPCTMASAAVWTRRAGGNYAAAILVTILTNLFCFLFTPFWILIFTGQDANADSQLSFWNMLSKLALIVVLPMVLGQLVRLLGSVGNWAEERKPQIGAVAQIGILAMVCSGAAQNSSIDTGSDTLFEFLPFLAMLVAVNVVHVGTLLIAMQSASVFNMSRPDQIAVGFAGSQKTLMVGIALATDLNVSILPMLAFHICQLFVDTLIADRFANEKTANNDFLIDDPIPEQTDKDPF